MVSRRDWLRGAGALLLVGEALAAGRLEKGVYRVRGDVRVNGAPAREGMEVRPGDTVITGRDGEIVFVIGRDAMLVRANSRIEILADAGKLAATGLRIVTGAVLSVFTPGAPKQLRTPTATIGVRGTAAYVEAEAARTYVCTCYGEAEIASVDEPAARETVRTTHHEQPRYVLAKGAPQMLVAAPVINHTDLELEFLENLVGRRPPFAGTPGTRY